MRILKDCAAHPVVLLRCWFAARRWRRPLLTGSTRCRRGAPTRPSPFGSRWRDEDNPQAQYGLALLLETGGRTFGKNETGGCAALSIGRRRRRCAGERPTWACFTQRAGASVRTRRRQLHFWTEASEAGHHMAQFNLGLSYYTGKGGRSRRRQSR